MIQTRKSKLSSRPPKAGVNSADQDKVKEFILGALEPEFQSSLKNADAPTIGVRSLEISKTSLPWEGENVRNDVYKVFNLRLPEPFFKKLEYVAQIRKESKHKICLDILLPALNRELGIKG